MLSRSLVVLLSLMVLCLSTESYASDLELDLRKAAKAGLNNSFKGQYVHQTNSDMSTFVVFRLNKKGELYERRIALNGPARELIKNGKKIEFLTLDPATMYLARLDSISLFPDILPFDPTVLQLSYDIKASQLDRAAGQECRWVWLEPKDNKRYIQGLCLEQNSMFPLVHVYLDADKKLVEVNAFTRIDFVRPHAEEILANAQLTVKDSIELRPKLTSKQVDVDIDDPYIASLPQYFFIIEGTANQIHKNNGRHYLIGDGLVAISLFIEELNGGRVLPESKYINGALSLVVRQNNKYKLTAVGDMPPKGLGLLLEQINIKDQ